MYVIVCYVLNKLKIVLGRAPHNLQLKSIATGRQSKMHTNVVFSLKKMIFQKARIGAGYGGPGYFLFGK